MPLEDYYAGDDGFHDLAVACEAEWVKCGYQEQTALLQAVGGDHDLAVVFYYHFGPRVFEVLTETIPALDGLTPQECLKTERGRRRFKECLWRMH